MISRRAALTASIAPVVVLCGCSRRPDRERVALRRVLEATQSAVGSDLAHRSVPVFRLHRLAGGFGSLADFRGHIVLANVWATWCPPCRAEMPRLERLARAYASRGVIVVGIDLGEAAEPVRRFVDQFGITYPILLDRGERYRRGFYLVGLPTSVTIAPDGTMLAAFEGEMSTAQMTQFVDRAIVASGLTARARDR